MKNKKYTVNIYFSGFCSYVLKAKNTDEAVIKARQLPIKEDEILSSLENWHEADEVVECIDREKP